MNHSYERTPDSIYAGIAGLRWPNYRITGAGPIAIVLNCSQRVVLTSFPMGALTQKGERCGPNCSHVVAPDGGFHKVEMLNLPPAKARFRNPANKMERD